MFLKLALQKPLEGQVLIQFRPVQAEWGNLNVLELRFGTFCQTMTGLDRKPDFNRPGDVNGYIAAIVVGCAFRDGQIAHADRRR